MNNKLQKCLLIALKIYLCLFVVVSLFIGIPAAAQGDIQKGGEIAGGKSDSIPIQLKVGQMVQGELESIRNRQLRLSIVEPTGQTIIHDFGYISTRGHFQYAPKTDGQYYLLVNNPDSFSVGTRGYRINYSIVPAIIPLGGGSGKNVNEPVETSDGPWKYIWWIVGIVVVLGVAFGLFTGRSRTKRYRPTGRIWREYREDDD